MPSSPAPRSRTRNTAAHSAQSVILGVLPTSATQLLVTLAALLVVTPFIEALPYGDVIEGILSSIILVSATLAVGGRRRTLVIALCLLIPGLATRWISHFAPERIPTTISLVLISAFTAFVAYELLAFVLRAPRVTREVISGAICAYLIAGLAWATAYRVVAELDPQAFTLPAGEQSLGAFESLYFSYITLISIGYGDIVPKSSVARMLAMTEGLAGLLFLVTFLSRLVAAYTPGDAGQSPAERR